MFARRGIAAAVLITLVGAADALADSRLFSVQTDQPGVTITTVVQDNRPLSLVGRNDAITFFRIENPAGRVGCHQSLTFIASNGREVFRDIDFCAADWDILVSLRGPAPVAPAAGILIVATDDPSAEIIDVYAAGEPVAIHATTPDGVQVALAPGQGGDGCIRDIGIGLADGRTIARMVDICRDNGFVLVPLVGPEGPPSVAGPGEPAPPVVANPVAPQPVQPQPVPPQSTAGMAWFNALEGGLARLGFGIPGTTAAELIAVCPAGSGEVSMTLARSAPELVPGGAVNVRIAAGAFAGVYAARGGDADFSGRALPVIDVNTGDPLWPALIRENVLIVTVGSGLPYQLSLKGSAVNARAFLSNCNPAPPPPPPPPGPLGQVAFVCDDGSALSAQFDHANNTVFVFEGAAPPFVLRRLASGEPRWVSGEAELVGLEEEIRWRRPGTFTRTCSPR